MVELLAYLGIGGPKEYHRWCLAHHPDRNLGDPTATRRFQVVSQAWAKVHKPEPELELTEEERSALVRRGRCNARVKEGVCWRRAAKGSEWCFYHQPGTAHMAFVDDPLFPEHFFGINYDYYRPRDDNMCTAKLDNDKFCTGWRRRGSLYCYACDRRPGRRRHNSV